MVFGEEGEDWTRDDLLKLGLELEKYKVDPIIKTARGLN